MEMSIRIEKRNTKLQNTRQSRKMSQAQLAEISGVPIRVLQNYEQGVRDISGAKLVTLLKLCSALNCRMSDIVTDEETVRLLDNYEKQ